MKAKITKTQYTGKILQNRKEAHFTAQYSVITSNLENPINARVYATNGRHYACVWINGKGTYISGGGYAGGYGYHRASAALESAIDDAGIVLSENIGGRGEGAMIEALESIAKALGYKKFKTFQAFA